MDEISHFLFLFGNFQHANHEPTPSITTTQNVDDLVKDNYIDIPEPSSSTNNSNDSSSNPKLGLTTMTAQVLIYMK